MSTMNDRHPSKWLKGTDFKESGPQQLTIASTSTEEIQGDGGREEKFVVWFREKDKGLILNKTNDLMISDLFGEESNDWNGKVVELYHDRVPMKGEMVDALRVRGPSPAAAQPDAAPQLDDEGSEKPF